jgi:putative FmdB family regulatory protein
MPLYEYECEACGERFEALVSARSKDQKRNCPACGSSETGRVASTFAVGTATKSSDACAGCCSSGNCPL